MFSTRRQKGKTTWDQERIAGGNRKRFQPKAGGQSLCAWDMMGFSLNFFLQGFPDARIGFITDGGAGFVEDNAGALSPSRE